MISKNRKIGYIASLVLAPIFLIFTFLGDPERGLIGMSLFGVFFSVLYVKRDIIRKSYFIITISILFLLHFVFFLSFGFPDLKNLPGIIVMPFAVLDLILVLVIIEVVRKLVGDSTELHDN
jgi:hypothetical protein